MEVHVADGFNISEPEKDDEIKRLSDKMLEFGDAENSVEKAVSVLLDLHDEETSRQSTVIDQATSEVQSLSDEPLIDTFGPKQEEDGFGVFTRVVIPEDLAEVMPVDDVDTFQQPIIPKKRIQSQLEFILRLMGYDRTTALTQIDKLAMKMQHNTRYNEPDLSKVNKSVLLDAAKKIESAIDKLEG